jgi:hypothetical protein
MTKNLEQALVPLEERKKETISINASEVGDVAAARRVYEAFRKAEGLADFQGDDTRPDRGVYRDMAAYGERSGISQESIESAAKEIGVEESLAKFDREETIVRNRFKDRLRRLAAQAAAVISLMSPNMSRADEYVQEPTTYSQPAEPIERPQAEKPSSADSQDQAETEKSDPRVQQTMEMTDQEWEQYVAREEQYQARLAFEKEFRERSFTNEKELLQSLHDAALNHENEFLAVYMVGADGHVDVAFGGFGDMGGVAGPDIVKQMHDLRSEGKKIVFAHTHPLAVAKQAAIGMSIEGAFERMPPSLTDLRSASLFDWLDRYDNADNRNEIDKLVNATEAVTVDSEGVWRFRADFFHPYFQEQREAATTDAAVKHVLTVTKDASDLKRAEAFYSQMVIPDSIIMERVMQTATQDLREDGAALAVASMTGSIASGGEYEFSNEQMKVGTAVTPEEKAATTEAFIGYCKERGIEMSFTPFENGGK